MSDIFISYAEEDRGNAEQLAKALEGQSWSVWWDRNIPAGEDFDDVIERELNAPHCVIVLWSEKSIRSKYVKGEAREARDQKKLIPVFIC